MNTKKFRPIIYSLLILAFITACAQAPAQPEPTVAATPKPSVQLTECRVEYRDALCGSLPVYENRAAHSGRMINLKIIVFKAPSNQPAADPIFYLAGGPGGAAASEDAKYQQFPDSLSKNHDLVFVDQRGTGGSNRVLVPTDQPDLTGLSLEEADPIIKAWIADYLANIDMDPRYYATAFAMDDLDDVREALGYDKINLVGYSYGATAAQYYLRQHEEHLRTVTLGVGSLLDIPVFEQEPYNSQRAIDSIFDLCLADTACKTAFPEIKNEFAGLMDRLETQPVTSTFTSPATLKPSPVIFTADYFGGLLRAFIKDAARDPSLPLFIHRAYQENDWTGFTNYMAQGGGPEWWGDQIMEHVIRCDEKWAAFDPTIVAQFSQDSFLAAYSTRLAQEQAFSCQYTPEGVTPEGSALQTGSQVSVLMWNGDLDPLNPPENMAGAEKLWPNSIALVSPYQSHAISGYPTVSCLFTVMDQFIQSGSAQGLDTSCLQSLPPLTFKTQ
jgi:pimeloyl-ACP methyl ester carboxylesterase